MHDLIPNNFNHVFWGGFLKLAEIEWIQKLEKEIDKLEKENKKLKKKIDQLENMMYIEEESEVNPFDGDLEVFYSSEE